MSETAVDGGEYHGTKGLAKSGGRGGCSLRVDESRGIGGVGQDRMIEVVDGRLDELMGPHMDVLESRHARRRAHLVGALAPKGRSLTRQKGDCERTWILVLKMEDLKTRCERRNCCSLVRSVVSENLRCDSLDLLE